MRNTQRPKSVNGSILESTHSNGSHNGSQRRVAGSIFKGNSATKNLRNSYDGTCNLNNSVSYSRKSFDKPDILVHESPVIALDKELNFYTEQSKHNNAEISDLNALLQLNEGNCEEDTHPRKLEYSLLNRHNVVKEDIMNLPRPAPATNKSLASSIKNFDEPMNVNGVKIYEPFFPYIWECLATQPLTAIKLKLSKPRVLETCIENTVDCLQLTMQESEARPSSKLNALQFRLIRILYKKHLYPLVLKLQETIYQYFSSRNKEQDAKIALKQVVGFSRKINADRSLVSKVRQNKAFKMRRQQNIDKFGQKRSTSQTQSKYEEREQECEFNYQLAKDIKVKLQEKACFLTLKLNMQIKKEIRILVNDVRGYTTLKRKVFEQFKMLGFHKRQENILVNSAVEHINHRKLFM